MKKSFTLKAFALGAFAAFGLSANALAPQAVKIDNEMANPVALEASKDAAKEMNLGFSIKPELVKASRENAMKVASHRAAPSWGEWTDGGEMKVTDYMNEREKTVSYQVRQDNANEGDFQVKVKFFDYSNTAGPDVVITVSADAANPGEYVAETETVYDLGWTVSVNMGNNVKADWNVWWGSHVTVLNYFISKGEEIGADVISSWQGSSYYLPEEGKIMIQGLYFEGTESSANFGYVLTYTIKDAAGNVIGYEYDKFFRQGPDFKNYDYTLGYNEGYFSHEKNAKTGKFTMPIELNDCGDLYIGLFKSLTATTAKNYVAEIMKVIDGQEGATLPQDIIKVTKKDGNIELPLTLGDPYTKGAKKMLYILLFKNDEYFYSNYSSTNGLTNITIQLSQDDVNFYEAGTAEYKDATMYDMLPTIFGQESYEDFVEWANDQYEDEFPEEYVVTTRLQANSAVAGQYRLVAPYQEYYNNYLSDYLYYDRAMDNLVFTVDGTNVTVAQNTNGLYFTNQNSQAVMLNYGSVNQYSESAFTASADCFGSLAGDVENGKITFPTPHYDGNGNAAANVVAPLGWMVGTYNVTSGVAEAATECELVYQADESYIAFGDQAGIKDVTADSAVDNANAPVEYFNLQGIRVANPEAGQLLIRRQGTSVSKVVIR